MNDYEKNLQFCESFIRNSEGKLPKGMMIRIGNSDHEPNTIVQIIYRGDPGCQEPSQGATIFLHQEHRSGYGGFIVCFFEEFHQAFRTIYDFAKRKNLERNI